MGKGFDASKSMVTENTKKRGQKLKLKSKGIKKVKRRIQKMSGMDIGGSAMEIEPKKKNLISKKVIIKQLLKKKKKIKANPRLFKDFNNKVEKESQNLLLSGKLSKGQKRRLKRKTHFLKKKNFGQFIEAEVNPEKKRENEIKSIFNMNSLDQNLEAMELDIESEMQKFNTKKDHNNGIESKQINKVVNKEIRHMDKVMSHPEFQKDPFAAIRTHLMNNINE